MNKVEEIFKSWMISFDPSQEQADLAIKRIEICDACEFRVLTPIGPFFNIAKCSVCGCSLKQKIFTPITYKDPGGSCPHSKWSFVEDEWLNSKNL
jgi:hypothetical protein